MDNGEKIKKNTKNQKNWLSYQNENVLPNVFPNTILA